jgi:glycosyltransferase involved in cell wall biosynthesis
MSKRATRIFPGRLALQQRVIPAYRVPFFDLLAESCDGGLTLFAGQPLLVESIATANQLASAEYVPTKNRHFRDPQSAMFLCWQEGMIDWLEAQDPDALIVEANPRYLSTRQAIRWMKTQRRHVLGWGLGAPRSGNPIELYFRINFLRSLDGVIAYSRRGANEYRSLGLRNVFVAYNAVSPRPRQVPLERQQKDTPTVLFVGRLQERKRIDILLRGCASLPPALQPRLVIIGDGPAISDLQSLARGVYPQAEFIGAKHGPELAPFFNTADLFALPGTGGLAVQEAMTYGLPVIVAQGDGTQDDLVRPENGWQVPPGDQAAFTTTLQKALSDVKLLRQMGAESYRIVAVEINLEAMVEAFIDVLNKFERDNQKTG